MTLQTAASWTPAAAALITQASSSFRQPPGAPQAHAAAAPPSPSAAAAQQPSPAAAPRPQQLDLAPLNGIRAVGSMLVAAFHCWLVWTMLVPSYGAQASLSRTPLVSLAKYGGPVAVDFFLVITGMLAAYQLVPQLEDAAHRGSPWAIVRRYWRRRAARLLPAFLAANAAMALGVGASKSAALPPEALVARDFAMGQCPAGVWPNLLALTNMRLASACGIHLWSLALQFQFYLAFPLALLALRPRAAGFRARLAAALAAVIGTGTAWRLWRMAGAQVHLPLGHLALPAELASYQQLLDATYFPTGPRVAQLAVGAALGLLLRTPQAVGWLLRRQGAVAAAAAALQAVFLHGCCHWNTHGVPGEALWQPLTVKLFSALFYYGSPFMSALAAASLLALMLHSDPLHSRIASVLGSSRLLPLANLSYCLYLVHELARFGALLLLPASALTALIASAPLAGLAALCALTLAAGYACALVLHVFVEKRF